MFFEDSPVAVSLDIQSLPEAKGFPSDCAVRRTLRTTPKRICNHADLSGATPADAITRVSHSRVEIGRG